jgi:hypothetical protein
MKSHPKINVVSQASANELSGHILPVSATMLGVCMTVISVIQLIPKNNVTTYADEILAVAALIFMSSTLLSYLSIRKRIFDSVRLEIWADLIFMFGLFLMALDCVLVSFDLFIN